MSKKQTIKYKTGDKFRFITGEKFKIIITNTHYTFQFENGSKFEQSFNNFESKVGNTIIHEI